MGNDATTGGRQLYCTRMHAGQRYGDVETPSGWYVYNTAGTPGRDHGFVAELTGNEEQHGRQRMAIRSSRPSSSFAAQWASAGMFLILYLRP